MSRYAYADPPYPGHTRRSRYKRDPRNAEVDHAALIAGLVAEYPDGWALSSSSSALRDLLPLCPPDVRVMAWVKPFCSFKPNVNPAYAWEPLIVRGGRKRERFETTVRDWVSANIVLKKGLCGAKPEPFCVWLFAVLGMRQDDQLDDLYPGTGVVTETLEKWRAGKSGAGSRSTGEPMDADQIIAAARRCQTWTAASRKVYLCDVAAELGTTLAALAPALIALHRETGCLARADMVDAFDGDKLVRSTVETGVRYGSQLLDLETIDAIRARP